MVSIYCGDAIDRSGCEAPAVTEDGGVYGEMDAGGEGRNSEVDADDQGLKSEMDADDELATGEIPDYAEGQGCGCRISGSGPAVSILLWLVALVAVAGRRIVRIWLYP